MEQIRSAILLSWDYSKAMTTEQMVDNLAVLGGTVAVPRCVGLTNEDEYRTFVEILLSMVAAIQHCMGLRKGSVVPYVDTKTRRMALVTETVIRKAVEMDVLGPSAFVAVSDGDDRWGPTDGAE